MRIILAILIYEYHVFTAPQRGSVNKNLFIIKKTIDQEETIYYTVNISIYKYVCKRTHQKIDPLNYRNYIIAMNFNYTPAKC